MIYAISLLVMIHQFRLHTCAVWSVRRSRAARNVLCDARAVLLLPLLLPGRLPPDRPGAGVLRCGFDDNLLGKCKFHLSTRARAEPCRVASVLPHNRRYTACLLVCDALLHHFAGAVRPPPPYVSIADVNIMRFYVALGITICAPLR